MISYWTNWTWPHGSNAALYAVNKVTHTQGCIFCPMYLAAGTSLDWALGVADIHYVYTIELRDTGDFGVLLPLCGTRTDYK